MDMQIRVALSAIEANKRRKRRLGRQGRLGWNKVTNGLFEYDGGWPTIDPQWAISDGAIWCDGTQGDSNSAQFQQDVGLLETGLVEVSFKIIGQTAGLGISNILCGGFVNSTGWTGDGRHVFQDTLLNTSGDLVFYAEEDFVGGVTDVQVRDVL